MIKGGDSYSNGHEFQSRYHAHHVQFITFICSKIELLLKKTKMKQKEPRKDLFKIC